MRIPQQYARAVVIGATFLTTMHAQSMSDPAAPPPAILQDYIYGYAPVTMEAVRALQTAVPDTTIPGLAPINQFARLNRLITANDRFIPRPNADTLYTTAWLDLSREPIILHV